MNVNPLTVVALGALVLALVGLSRVSGRRRGRRGRRRSFGQALISKLPWGRKETPRERSDRQVREFRAYQRSHPGATRMPIDTPPPAPAERASLWGWAVRKLQERNRPF